MTTTKPLPSAASPSEPSKPSALLPPPSRWAALRPQVPLLPGVYWFLDAGHKILYIGKAKKLRTRLHSYQPAQAASSRIAALIDATAHTRFQTVATEFSAILLEAELIRLHQPPYNIRLKDDKSNLYIVITKEPFPRVLMTRRSDHKRFPHPIRHVYGPFISARQTREIYMYSRRLFPFCTATDQDRRHHRPCFYYHLHLCPGACTGTVAAAAYAQHIRRLHLFLSGHHRRLTELLTRHIRQAIKTQAYEEAATLKTRLQALQSLRLSASMAETFDLPEMLGDQDGDRLINLKKVLRSCMRLPNETRLHRIEGYDIANIQGQFATGSMVVLTDGAPDPASYRHFKIQSAAAPNDFGMLQEILTRRQRHPEWGTPELIVVDGGTPQLKAVQKVLKSHIPLVGLAKNPDRLVIPPAHSLTGKTATLRLTPGHPGTRLLTLLRDESHRFARGLHHHLHLKTYQ